MPFEVFVAFAVAPMSAAHGDAAVARTRFAFLANVEGSAYLRVSTQGQEASGAGLEAQLAACKAHAARLGVSILGTFSDPAPSGRDGIEERPGLQAVIRTVQENPGTVVIVHSISRLARRQSLLFALLDDRGPYAIPVSSASEAFDTSTPMGRAMLGMIATFAELEADLVSERTHAALAAVKARGIRLGATNMVEVVRDGVRSIDPERAAMVARVRAAYETGGFTHASLAAHLNASGVPSVKGGRWHPSTVAKALRAAMERVERERVA